MQDEEKFQEAKTAKEVANARLAQIKLDEALKAQVPDIMQFFAYQHLPDHLQQISRPFGEMAKSLIQMLPANTERNLALRKLLEAKDCAVRANLIK